jgi:tetratricopeptide (TPR) repeat protein
MAALKDLLRDLARALESKDLDQVAAVRRTIAAGFPETPEGAEARYKLGLDALFRSKKLDDAADHLREAAKAKAPPWSTAARVSLGIVLLSQGKPQQALFELRRVAGQKPPSIHSAQASGLAVMALRTMGNAAEAERARKAQLDLLKGLTQSADAETKALAHFMLGMEHKFDGDRRPAKDHLEKAIQLGLPPHEKASADQALQDL